MVVSRPPRRHRAPRSTKAATMIAAGMLMLGACSGDDDERGLGTTTTTTTSSTTTTSEPTSTTSSTSPDSTDPSSDEEAQILDRYLAFWDARFEANTDPVNPDDERLADLATGAQLDNVREETRQRAEAGLAFRRPEDSITERRPRIVRIDEDVATIQDCAINDGIIYRVDSGEVVNDDIVTQNVDATMRRVDGSWKLERATLLQEWEGVAGCANSSD